MFSRLHYQFSRLLYLFLQLIDLFSRLLYYLWRLARLLYLFHYCYTFYYFLIYPISIHLMFFQIDRLLQRVPFDLDIYQHARAGRRCGIRVCSVVNGDAPPL